MAEGGDIPQGPSTPSNVKGPEDKFGPSGKPEGEKPQGPGAQPGEQPKEGAEPAEQTPEEPEPTGPGGFEVEGPGGERAVGEPVSEGGAAEEKFYNKNLPGMKEKLVKKELPTREEEPPEEEEKPPEEEEEAGEENEAARLAGEAAGEAAGIKAGTGAGTAAGALAGAVAGDAKLGAEAGAEAGRAAGEEAGRLAGAQAGKIAGAAAGDAKLGEEAGAKSGAKAGALAGEKAGREAGAEAGATSEAGKAAVGGAGGAAAAEGAEAAAGAGAAAAPEIAVVVIVAIIGILVLIILGALAYNFLKKSGILGHQEPQAQSTAMNQTGTAADPTFPVFINPATKPARDASKQQLAKFEASAKNKGPAAIQAYQAAAATFAGLEQAITVGTNRGDIKKKTDDFAQKVKDLEKIINPPSQTYNWQAEGSPLGKEIINPQENPQNWLAERVFAQSSSDDEALTRAAFGALLTSIDQIRDSTYPKSKKLPLVLTPDCAQAIINSGNPAYKGDDKLDQRVFDYLAYLVNSPRPSTITQDNPNGQPWDHLRLSRCRQDDPQSKEAPTTERDETMSAHTLGNAVDISEAGTLKCKRAFPPKTKYKPVKLSWQTTTRPGGNNLIKGDFPGLVLSNMTYGEIADELGLENVQEGNITNLAEQVGVAQILEALNIDPTASRGTLSKNMIAEAYLAQALGLDASQVRDIVGSKDNNETTVALGRAVLEEQWDLPAGSLKGNNFEEILKSASVAFEKKYFDLEGTDWNGNLSDEEMGKAILMKYFPPTASDTEWFQQIIEQVSSNPGAVDVSLTLPKGTTAKFVKDEIHFDDFTRQVGQAHWQHRVLTATTDPVTGKPVSRTADRMAGLPPGALDGLRRGDTRAQLGVGALLLGRALQLAPDDRYYTDYNILKIDLGRLDTTALGVELSIEELSQIIDTKDPKKRNEVLKKLGDREFYRIAGNYADHRIELALKKAGLSYVSVSFSQIREAMSDPQKSAIFLGELGGQIISGQFDKYGPTINGYKLSSRDLEDAKAGRWWQVAYRVGGHTLEDKLDLPDGTLAVITGGEDPQVAMARAGLTQTGKSLGIDFSNIEVDDSWFGSGSLQENFGRKQMENSGLKPGTFRGNIDSVIQTNSTIIFQLVGGTQITGDDQNQGEKALAAALGLEQAELADLRGGRTEGTDQAAVEKAQQNDRRLGIPLGSTQDFSAGRISAEEYSKRVGASKAQQVQTDVVFDAIMGSVDDKYKAKFNSGDLRTALGLTTGASQEQTKQAALNVFGQIYGLKMDTVLNTTPGFAQSLLTRPENSRAIVAEEGAKQLLRAFGKNDDNYQDILSAFLAGNNQEAEAAVINTAAQTIVNKSSDDPKAKIDIEDAKTIARGDFKNGGRYIAYSRMATFARGLTNNNLKTQLESSPDDLTYQNVKLMSEGDVRLAEDTYAELLEQGKTEKEARDQSNAVRNQTKQDAQDAMAYNMGDIQLKQAFGKNGQYIPWGTTEALAVQDQAKLQEVGLNMAVANIKIDGVSLAERGFNGQMLGDAIKLMEGKGELTSDLASWVDQKWLPKGFPPGTAMAVADYLETKDTTKITNLAESFGVQKIGHYLDKELFGGRQGTTQNVYNVSKELYRQMTHGTGNKMTRAGLIVAIYDMTGLGKAVDKTLGLPPGLSSQILSFALTGNPMGLALFALSSLMAYKCENPMETAQYNVRELLKMTLEAPSRPTQIITFNSKDILYLSGQDPGDFRLKEDKADPVPALQNIIKEKFYPGSEAPDPDSRRGIWAGEKENEDNVWFFDHVHVGY